MIESLAERLIVDFGLFAITAAEIEFYVPGLEESGMLESFWNVVKQACQQRGIRIYSYGSESGKDQYEIAIGIDGEPARTCAHIVAIKDFITNLCGKFNMQARFDAKPFQDQPGSGLHLHLSLHHEDGKNVFFKDDISMSNELKYSIGGLLEWSAPCMPVFAPRPSSYARLAPKNNAPTTVSWGANNRTTCVRLPDASHEDKHIELRNAGSDANPAAVMAVMLAAVHFGLAVFEQDQGGNAAHAVFL
ncbi:MAG: hypothetical protein EBV03_10480, partial [Proteobacteria bacterium]|nr:hypothetical protein [Pseudomonadota bacterium]